jgi:hypothetical protein
MSDESTRSRTGSRSSHVAIAGVDGWSLYAAGYRRAAELLIEQARTTYEINTLVFPIVFLYRHYVEVTLKEVIRYGRYLDGSAEASPGGHGLNNLWGEARALMRRHAQDVSSAILRRLDTLVRHLAELDPSSEATRYPATRDGAPLFPWDTVPINLDQLAIDMREVAALIEPIAGKLFVYRDLEAEFRSDYYRGL